MNIKKIAFAAVLALGSMSGSAQEFFSTEAPARMLTIGVRAGLNQSNLTINKNTFDLWNVNSWGMGTDFGAEVGIHFRDYLSIRPSFWFESRSGNYAYASLVADPEQPDGIGSLVQLGHYRTYHFTIPVMAVVSFNITDKLRWNVMAGPYISWKLGTTGNSVVEIPRPEGTFETGQKKFDAGLRVGSGLELKRRWVLEVAYEAGGCHVWREAQLGGRNKCWQFIVGYNF